MRHRLALGVIAALVLCADAVVISADPGSTSAARSAPTTTATTSTTTAIPVADPDVAGLVQPPAPGLYRYRNTSAGPNVVAFEWAERISIVSSAGEVTREHIRTRTGIDQTVDFTPTAETQIAYSQVGTSVADEVTCDQGRVVLLNLPLSPRLTWRTTEYCTNLLGDSLVDQRTIDVVGRTTQRVDTKAVPVWELVILSVQTSTPSKGGTPHVQSTTTTMDIAARYGLVVRQVVQRGSNPSTIHIDQLIALDPA